MEEAERLRREAVARAENENKEALAAARRAAEERIDAMRIASYENAANLTETVEAKTAEAAEMIVSAILGEK